MTDIEAKALDAAAQSAGLSDWDHASRYADPITLISVRAHAETIETREADKARHAAELREQAERFSEACLAVKANYDGLAFPTLTPFILPAPDPLKSWMHKSGYEGNSVVEQALADLAQNGGKIVWEAGE